MLCCGAAGRAACPGGPTAVGPSKGTNMACTYRLSHFSSKQCHSLAT